MTSDRPNLLLVPGAFHGGWVWHDVGGLLRDEAWQVSTVDLPSSSGGNPDIGMYDDAALLRRILNESRTPTTIVAHSYGGIPATQAAAGLDHVVKIVYVAAFQLGRNESLLSSLGWQMPPWFVVEGTRVWPGNPIEVFYGDLDPEVAARHAKRLRPSTLSSKLDPLTEPLSPNTDSSYVICEQDLALAPDRQEDMASRAGSVYRLPGGHSPMLARPAELAALLTRIALPDKMVSKSDG